MRTFRIAICIAVVASAIPRAGAQDFLDRVDQALTFSAFHDDVRARLSGTLDLEGYIFQQPAPGLILSKSDAFFNHRLSLFFDSQLGPHVYFFTQSRFDRGFDPRDKGAQVRLDEYALRLTPWDDGRFTLQAGKFAQINRTPQQPRDDPGELPAKNLSHTVAPPCSSRVAMARPMPWAPPVTTATRPWKS